MESPSSQLLNDSAHHNDREKSYTIFQDRVKESRATLIMARGSQSNMGSFFDKEVRGKCPTINVGMIAKRL